MKRIIPLILLIAMLFGLSACECGSGVAAGGKKTTAILAVNDIYRIGAVDEGARGGIARLRTLRAELEKEFPELLLMHAGDILYPSMLSRSYNGRQMVDMLNRLDGDETAFDERMWVTFGNHEFDKSKMDDYYGLKDTVRSSGFNWLASNIRFSEKMGGMHSKQVVASRIVNSGGIKLGLFSLTIDSKVPAYVEAIEDYESVARQLSAQLRADGAEVVVALTHLSVDDDLALLNRLKGQGPDLIIGGHEHNYQTPQSEDGRYVIKADADVRSANLVRISLAADGKPVIAVERRDLDERVRPDAALERVVKDWQQRFDHEICSQKPRPGRPGPFKDSPQPDGCLDDVFSHARVKLVAEELQIRMYETNFGNWIADQALAAYAEQGAQVAFINSGSLRLNQDLPEGSDITRSHLLEIFAYSSPMGLIEIDGKTLQQIANRAIEEWTGNGHWLQIAGFAFRHDVDKGRAYDLTLLTADGPRPIKPDDKILAVSSNFLIDPGMGDQDGYDMLKPPQMRVIVEPSDEKDLRELVRNALEAVKKEGIAPVIEGRICNSERGGECLALGS